MADQRHESRNERTEQNAAFEKWLDETMGLQAEWQSERNCYKEFAAHLAWKAWCARSETAFSMGDPHPCDISRAVREQTIEECAKVCEQPISSWGNEYAARIRALKNAAPQVATNAATDAISGKSAKAGGHASSSDAATAAAAPSTRTEIRVFTPIEPNEL